MPRNRPDVSAEEKEREIRAAARGVFYAEGFDKASVARIAKAAGVTPNTLYWYFPSKDHLFAAVVEELIGIFLGGLEHRRPDEPLLETLRWVVHAMETAKPFVVTIHEKSQSSEAIAEVHDRFHANLADLLKEMLAARGVSSCRIPAMISIASFTVEGLLMHSVPAGKREEILCELARIAEP